MLFFSAIKRTCVNSPVTFQIHIVSMTSHGKNQTYILCKPKSQGNIFSTKQKNYIFDLPKNCLKSYNFCLWKPLTRRGSEPIVPA